MTGELEVPVLAPAKPYVFSPGTRTVQSSLEVVWPIGSSSAEKQTLAKGSPKIFLRYEEMERGRPYPVKVGDHWIIAVLHHGASQAALYRVPDDD